MIDLQTWLEVVDYRITEGSEFTWSCFGDKAYQLSSWNGDHDGYSMNVVFDTETQIVYCVETCDYKNQRAYRIINPDYKQQYKLESNRIQEKDCAWDDVEFIDLEVTQDWIDKSTAIRQGKNYDDRVTIPLDLPEDSLMFLFQRAHEADMTFNDYIEKILRDVLNDQTFVNHLKTVSNSK